MYIYQNYDITNNISRGDQLPEIYKKLLPQSTGKNFSCEAHSDKDSESCLFSKEIKRVSVDQMRYKLLKKNIIVL